jgi:type IV secretion system protein VirB1
MLDCPDLAVPVEIMHHVVHVESARNPFAIGVVGGRLSRQPRSLDEALAAVQTLKEQGYNFSVGIAQVNRYNLARYGLSSYAQAFETCPNLKAGSQILKECHDRARDWGKAFSCYYSGNFVTGFEHGYVQKVFDSMQRAAPSGVRVADITVIPRTDRSVRRPARDDGVPLRAPMATPNCSTYGRSNCSRQDGRMVTIRA